jgi:hypothetical protein
MRAKRPNRSHVILLMARRDFGYNSHTKDFQSPDAELFKYNQIISAFNSNN